MIKQGFETFIAALLVKIVTYSVFSAIYVWLLLWAGVVESYNWKLVLVMTFTILIVRIFIAEIMIKNEIVLGTMKKK